MEDRKRTLAAATIILGLVVFAAIIVGLRVTGKKVVSPVPDEDIIKILFITPTPEIVITPTVEPSPTPTPKKK
jgi:hypothetical protein